MNSNRLNNTPGQKRVWNAEGDAATTTVAPAAAATTSSTTSTGCSTCTKKKLACVAAGVLIGVVATLLFKKGTKAAA